jgi:hypothetical protein
MKLARVDDEVRDEQREINVRLDALRDNSDYARLEALREQKNLTEEVRQEVDSLKSSVKNQLTSKITELYNS